MTRDFTLAMYRRLCDEIKRSSYRAITVAEYCKSRSQDNFAIMRHDVDRLPRNALMFANIEQEFNIKSTYYFRMHKGSFEPSIIRDIAGMGHEIGFHYEVLDKAKGNLEKARDLFESELQEFRKICNIETICMHGTPLSAWDNRDMWDHYDFREFGLAGEAYRSVNFEDVAYFSDTGRDWSGRYSIKDHADAPIKKKINNTSELIDTVKKKEYGRLYITTHPERWNDNMIDWTGQFVIQNLKNIVKLCIRKYKDAY